MSGEMKIIVECGPVGVRHVAYASAETTSYINEIIPVLEATEKRPLTPAQAVLLLIETQAGLRRE